MRSEITLASQAVPRLRVHAILAALFTRAKHRREMAHLALLDDRLLRDIGLTRADLDLWR